jgi:hypothetical protein
MINYNVTVQWVGLLLRLQLHACWTGGARGGARTLSVT